MLRDKHDAIPGAVAEGGLAGATVTLIILPLGLVDEAGEEVAGGPVRPGLKWLWRWLSGESSRPILTGRGGLGRGRGQMQ